MKHYRRWTVKERSLLCNMYAYFSVSFLMDFFGRTEQSIRTTVRVSGVKLTEKERSKRWSDSAKRFTGSKNPNWKNGISKNKPHYRRIQEMRYPKRVKARTLARKAVYSGKLIKTPCVVCGNKKTEGHHEDYNKPLEVVWLCHKHHRERHNVAIHK